MAKRDSGLMARLLLEGAALPSKRLDKVVCPSCTVSVFAGEGVFFGAGYVRVAPGRVWFCGWCGHEAPAGTRLVRVSTRLC